MPYFLLGHFASLPGKKMRDGKNLQNAFNMAMIQQQIGTVKLCTEQRDYRGLNAGGLMLFIYAMPIPWVYDEVKSCEHTNDIKANLNVNYGFSSLKVKCANLHIRSWHLKNLLNAVCHF